MVSKNAVISFIKHTEKTLNEGNFCASRPFLVFLTNGPGKDSHNFEITVEFQPEEMSRQAVPVEKHCFNVSNVHCTDLRWPKMSLVYNCVVRSWLKPYSILHMTEDIQFICSLYYYVAMKDKSKLCIVAAVPEKQSIRFLLFNQPALIALLDGKWILQFDCLGRY